MKKLIFLISLFCLINQCSINASEICGLNNQDDGKGKTEAEYNALVEIDENIISLEKQANIQQDKKAVDDKEKKEFENLYSRYPKQVNALVGALKNLRYLNSDFANSGYPPEIAKLIVGYCESPNYELCQSLLVPYEAIQFDHKIFNDRSGTKVIPLKNGDIAYQKYGRLLILRENENNRWRTIQILEHVDLIDSFNQLDNGNLASWSDQEIKIWQTNSDKTWTNKQTLESRGTVNSIWFKNNELTICYRDGRIKILHENDFNKLWYIIHNIKIYEDFSSVSQLRNGDLILIDNPNSSFDHSKIKILHINKNGTWNIQKLVLQRFDINSIIESNDGSLAVDNGVIHIFKKNYFGKWQFTQSFWGQPNGITSMIELKNGNLACGYGNGAISIYKQSHSGKFVWVQNLENGIGNLIAIMQLNNGDIVSCYSNDLIKIWRQDSNGLWKCIQTLGCAQTQCPVSIYKINNGGFIYCSNDFINIYNAPFGDFFREQQSSLIENSVSNNNNYISKLYNSIKDNPIKTSTAIATFALIAKYRNQIWNIFKK